MFDMDGPKQVTGANAGGPRQFAIRTRLAARVGQFCRSGDTTRVRRRTNIMQTRFGSPKYAGIWSTLLPLGYVAIWLSRYVGHGAADWLFLLGSVMGVVGILAFAAGWIAERRDWKLKQEADKK